MTQGNAFPAGLSVIPKDIMQMALGIVSGKIRTLTVTEAMVGRTVAWTGEMHLIDIDPALLAGLDRAPKAVPASTSASALPALSLAPVPAPRAAAPVTSSRTAARGIKPSGQERGSSFRDLIRTALQLEPGKCLNISQIADLIEADTLGKNRAALRGAVRYHLQAMVQCGEVDAVVIDRRACYRILVAQAA